MAWVWTFAKHKNQFLGHIFYILPYYGAKILVIIDFNDLQLFIELKNNSIVILACFWIKMCLCTFIIHIWQNNGSIHSLYTFSYNLMHF